MRNTHINFILLVTQKKANRYYFWLVFWRPLGMSFVSDKENLQLITIQQRLGILKVIDNTLQVLMRRLLFLQPSMHSCYKDKTNPNAKVR